ncbi:MAG TPA: cysteine hydrolase family protein [Azonexus sp.]|nr:cysteine hydrolase family protein [Azonexus sp.]
MTSPKRALIVIDVQNEYFTGKLRIEYPDVRDSLANIGRAMDAASTAGIPVVVVQHLLPAGAPVFARGSEGAALHPAVAGRPHDHLVDKAMASALVGTDLGAWLRQREIDTLTVVGYMTHNCDDSTVRQAAHEGWKVEFLHDAAGALPYANAAGTASAEEIHRVFMVVMHTGFAAVATTEQWLQALAKGEALPADNVFLSNQRAVAAGG